jgi:hypothetical protein
LAAVFMRAGALPSPMDLGETEIRAIGLLGGSIADIRLGLATLEGSLLIAVHQDGKQYWRFKHPTIRDAFATLVAQDRELLDIYLAGAPIGRIISEVSCGDLGLDGVSIVVPTDRFAAFITRLRSIEAKTEISKDSLNYFLAQRCNKTFLTQFIETDKAFVGALRVGAYLYAVSDVDVLLRLRQLSLLPEAIWKEHLETIAKLAAITPDSGFLQPRIRSHFTELEIREILERVRKDLIPNIDDRIVDQKLEHDGKRDPEEHFEELISALTAFRKAFHMESTVVNLLDRGIERIGETIEELRSEMPSEPDDDYDGSRVDIDTSNDTRSVYDDVDE